MRITHLLALGFLLAVLGAGWQYHRANAAAQTAAVAQAEHHRATEQHRHALQKLHKANAALRTETDRLATTLATTQGDIDALLQQHQNWAAVPVPRAIAERLRDYAAHARGPPD